MEILGVRLFADIYRGKRVLVTGHTGFKGSWLTLWLHELGAEVTGVSLPPDAQSNHWNLLQQPIDDHHLDIRDIVKLQQVFKEKPPEIVFHLAAQPLVRRSYRDPLETWSTNVMGTANILEACRQTSEVRAIVAITTDKCYENCEWPWGYRENDRLGGHDPYSASKAGAELVAASYRSAFFNTETAPLLATARAGNVIGGGDWSEDRLIPDLIRALERQQSLEIRSPHATRPWQHVLESLSGYLMLGQKLLAGDKNFAEAWNFGPELEGNRTVSEILGKLNLRWENMRWHITERPQPHEAILLYLDSSKARSRLHWQPVWNIDTTLEKTAEWYRVWLQFGQIISRQQLTDYISSAVQGDIEWAKL
ncbi:MAG: CDP-glucose 4,6-dehydratase [Magnetococcales bacterium]|nr:CDP-glucose 4,6-dehydratase [Magnetococcales bacterium]